MSSNPKTSKWYATPRHLRHKRKVEVSLTPDAAARLVTLAKESAKTRSAVVEALIMAAKVSAALAAGAILAACSATTETARAPYVERVTTPDGREGFVVECRNVSWCWQTISYYCPYGYNVIARDGGIDDIETSERMGAFGGSVFGASRTWNNRHQSMMVACKMPVQVTTVHADTTVDLTEPVSIVHENPYGK